MSYEVAYYDYGNAFWYHAFPCVRESYDDGNPSGVGTFINAVVTVTSAANIALSATIFAVLLGFEIAFALCIIVPP